MRIRRWRCSWFWRSDTYWDRCASERFSRGRCWVGLIAGLVIGQLGIQVPGGLKDRDRLAHNAATTYALTYLVGLVAVVGFLSYVAPRLMRVNLKTSSSELERSLGMTAKAQSMNSAYRPILVRGYRLPPALDGLTVAEVERR